MKFLLDANVEYRLARFLASLGHDVKTIAHDYPAYLSDETVLSSAVEEQRILITNDRDFGELIFRQQLHHTGIVLFRLKNSKDITEKLHWLETLLTTYKHDLHQYLVVTQHGVRIRKTSTLRAA